MARVRVSVFMCVCMCGSLCSGLGVEQWIYVHWYGRDRGRDLSGGISFPLAAESIHDPRSSNHRRLKQALSLGYETQAHRETSFMGVSGLVTMESEVTN